jgi:hypothetical protein
MTGLGAFWGRSGVMFVKADAATIGPSESLPAIKAQGYGWVAFDPKTGEWADERRLATANHLDIVAWTRVRTVTDLDTLVQARKRWAASSPFAVAMFPNPESPPAVNGVKPATDARDPILMSQILLAMSRAGRAAQITDGWVDDKGCWAGYKRWVGSVECFPEEDVRLADVRGCISHASAFFRAVVPALGAYGTKWKGRPPIRSDYAYGPQVVDGVPVSAAPFIVFPGDTVVDWKGWPA